MLLVRVCVCVCVCGWVGGCVGVWVCVYVYTHPPWRLLPNVRRPRHTRGTKIKDIMTIIPGASCEFDSSPFLNMSYFTSKD